MLTKVTQFLLLIKHPPLYISLLFVFLEAVYANKLKKKMLFLKMVFEYEPDGWLGFIIGSNKFYDFSGKYPFEQKLSELLKAIQLEYRYVAEKSTVRNEPTLMAVSMLFV